MEQVNIFAVLTKSHLTMLPSDFILFPLKSLQLQMFLDLQRVKNAATRRQKNELSDKDLE